MKELLFENPLPLYVALAAVELFLASLWFRGKTRRLAMALLIPPLLAGALAVTDLAVVTDREKLQGLVRRIAADVQSGNPEGVRPHLADDFYGEYVSREAAMQAIEKARAAYGVTAIRLSGLQVDVDGATAKMNVRTVLRYNVPDHGEGQQAVDWTVHWVLRGGRWQITSVERPQLATGF